MGLSATVSQLATRDTADRRVPSAAASSAASAWKSEYSLGHPVELLDGDSLQRLQGSRRRASQRHAPGLGSLHAEDGDDVEGVRDPRDQGRHPPAAGHVRERGQRAIHADLVARPPDRSDHRVGVLALSAQLSGDPRDEGQADRRRLGLDHPNAIAAFFLGQQLAARVAASYMPLHLAGMVRQTTSAPSLRRKALRYSPGAGVEVEATAPPRSRA